MSEWRAKKRFGQHFLCDQSVIHQIIDAINPQAHQIIVEIGPGQGALTDQLFAYLDTLHVIEIDHGLVKILSEKYKNKKKLAIHCADVLDYDFTTISKQPLRIVGNLPYNITTPLIFKLLKYKNLIENILFLVQDEVANRLYAGPNNKNYGYLSVITQVHYHVDKLFVVPPGAFSNPPKVNSAFIRLTPDNTNLEQIIDYDSFIKTVKLAFSHRRKTLKNCLLGTLNEAQINKAKISPGVRSETLRIEDFIRLANIYHGINH